MSVGVLDWDRCLLLGVGRVSLGPQTRFLTGARAERMRYQYQIRNVRPKKEYTATATAITNFGATTSSVNASTGDGRERDK